MKKILLLMVFFLVSSLYGQQISLLHKAVRDNKYVKAEFALKTGSDVNSFDYMKYYTPLMIAAKKGNLRMVKLLIRYGAKLDIKDGDYDKNYTALLYAIEGNHIKIVKYLLKKGANPKIVAVTGKIGQDKITAMDLVRNKPSMDYLFINPSELLLQSTKKKDLKGIIRSLRLGAKINVKDNNGWTPLMIAMGENSKKIVRYLKRKGGKTSFQIPSKVLYNSNGSTSGKVPIDKKKYLSGKQVVVLGNVSGQLKKEGFRFDSWKDSKGKTYRVSSKLTMGIKNIKLYVKWIPAHRVIYNKIYATGGIVPIDKNSYVEGEKVIVLGDVGKLKRRGYSFGGWQKGGYGKILQAGSQIAMNDENVSLKAYWLPKYKVVYSKYSYRRISGAVPIDKKRYLKGEEVTVLGNIGNLKWKGYSFGGWQKKGGYGKIYQVGDRITLDNNDVSFRIKWNRAYKVTYKSSVSGGFVRIDTHYYVKGEKVTVLGNIGKLKQPGYSFLGWISSSGRYFNVGSQFIIGKDLSLRNAVLRARWKKK